MEAVDQLADRKVKLVYYDLKGNLATESIWAAKEGSVSV